MFGLNSERAKRYCWTVARIEVWMKFIGACVFFLSFVHSFDMAVSQARFAHKHTHCCFYLFIVFVYIVHLCTDRSLCCVDCNTFTDIPPRHCFALSCIHRCASIKCFFFFNHPVYDYRNSSEPHIRNLFKHTHIGEIYTQGMEMSIQKIVMCVQER